MTFLDALPWCLVSVGRVTCECVMVACFMRGGVAWVVLVLCQVVLLLCGFSGVELRFACCLLAYVSM